MILTLEDGTNQSFKIPKDQKFNVDGQMVDAFGLKKGMLVTATKIVETPTSVTTQHKNATGTMPPPAPAADVPLLVAEGEPTPVPPEPTQAPASTEKTGTTLGSSLPLIGLGLFLLLVVWFAAKWIRGKPRT